MPKILVVYAFVSKRGFGHGNKVATVRRWPVAAQDLFEIERQIKQQEPASETQVITNMIPLADAEPEEG